MSLSKSSTLSSETFSVSALCSKSPIPTALRSEGHGFTSSPRLMRVMEMLRQTSPWATGNSTAFLDLPLQSSPTTTTNVQIDGTAPSVTLCRDTLGTSARQLEPRSSPGFWVYSAALHLKSPCIGVLVQSG